MTSSARRALKILDCISASSEPLGVTEIAKRSDVVPGTAFRSLDALERCGFVERYCSSTQYQIGHNASRLEHSLYAQFGLREICLPFLRRLSFASGETTSLVMPVGWYAVRVAVIAGTRSVVTTVGRGKIGFLDEDYSGRAILACFDKDKIARFISETAERSPKAITLDQTLKSIQKRGCSLDLQAPGSKHSAIAFPIHYKEEAIAAITIDGPIALKDNKEHIQKLLDWPDMVAEVESHISQFSTIVFNPFAHLDPTNIVL